MPVSPEQSTSISSPSAGSSPSNTVPITHGTWYSRLTMPMCDCGVPDRHTTAVSSSKIGARNVAPASATHATTPSADVSINASTSSGERNMRHAPRTGDASNTFVPLARSLIGRHCNQITEYDAAVPDDLDDACWQLLHAARLRGLVDDG